MNFNFLKSKKQSANRGRSSSVNKEKMARSNTLNRSLEKRRGTIVNSRQVQKAKRLASSPKSLRKRIIFNLKPRNIYHYWFSREGLIMALKLTGLGIFLFSVIIGIIFIYAQKNMPAIKTLYGKNLSGSISYYDRTGKTLLWQDYNAINRIPIPTNQMPSSIRNATVAIEDKKFYHEGALDILGTLRAAVHDAIHMGHQLQGGSTITEQLVKLNENWIGKVTIFRKMKEVILAVELSREYSKATILTGYLNIAPYGGVDYGIQAAAEDYFGIPASKLSLAQSAMLAGIPQSPAYYSPRSPSFSKSALLGRQHYILTLMQQQGYISKAQEAAAKAVNVLAEVKPATGRYANIHAPYFVMMAKQQLQKQFGATTANQGGWKVITTLSEPQQQKAQQLVAQNYNNVLKAGADEEATVVENVPTGQVTALVGGVNFYNPNFGQINYANLRINPGSTYKLYDYTSLINSTNAGAGSVLYDIQQPLPGYPCTNKALPLNGGNCLYDYDFHYPGPLPIRYAFAGSRNVPAVKAMLIAGEAKTIALSKAMGLTSGYKCYANSARTIPTTCYGSAAIGEGGYLRLNQSVNGFATDARLGNYVPQTFILKIQNSFGKNIYTWKQPPVDQVVKPDTAYIIDNILSDPGASYLPGSCSATNCTPLSSFGFKFQHTNGWDVAIKTGTTHADATGLMMGMTTQYAVGSWVGYHTATKPITPQYGGLEGLTEPLTRGMITYLTQNQKPINWTAPPGIKIRPAFVFTHPNHYYYGWTYPSPSMDIYPSWYKSPAAGKATYRVDIVSKRLATSCTPPLAIQTIGSNYNANVFSIDTFVNTGSTGSQYNTSKYDNVHNCTDAKPTINIQSNSVACNNGSCSFTVGVQQGTHPLSSPSFPMKINALVNNRVIPASCSFNPGVGTTNPPNAATGNCTFAYNTPGQQQVSAQVVDSVLYTGQSAPVTIDIPGITSPASGATIQGNNVTISWTGSGSDSFVVNASGPGNPNCSAGGGSTSCQLNNLSPGSYTITVDDTTNNEYSPPITINVQ